MSKHCEGFEEALSALVDGELEPVELIPTLDHLSDCVACREFYRGARALDEAVMEATLQPATEPAPEQVWERIRMAEPGVQPAPQPKRGGMVWAPLLAASLVLVVGLTALIPWNRDAGASSYVEVTVAGDPDRMSDERFVELTRELLEADQRYHRKMLEVMQVISSPPRGREGGGEGRAVDRGDGGPLREALLGQNEGSRRGKHDL